MTILFPIESHKLLYDFYVKPIEYITTILTNKGTNSLHYSLFNKGYIYDMNAGVFEN